MTRRTNPEPIYPYAYIEHSSSDGLNKTKEHAVRAKESGTDSVVTIDYGATHGATDPHRVVREVGTNLTSGREAHAVLGLCPDREAGSGDDCHHYSASSVENN